MMPEHETSATCFAPAARATAGQVGEQAGRFRASPLAGVLDAVTDLVLILNGRRQIVFANKRVLDLIGADSMDGCLGLRPGELMGCEHAFSMPGGCGTSEHCRECGAVLAIMAALDGLENEGECRITNRTPQGPQAMDFRVRVTPCQLEDETFLIFCLNDISHHKRRRVLERIFFHDILNTAGGMRSLAECLMNEAPAGLRQDAELLHFGFNHMVEEILAQRELLAAENDELATHPMTMNGLEVAHMALNVHANHEAAQGKAIKLDPASRECELVSDYTLLRRVLGNMVLNALEAIGPGQDVVVGCGPDNGRIRFWVRNPGVIPDDVRLKIFQRSFSSKGEGRGLGTYSIRLLTERYLDGKAGFTSSEDMGTEFFITLPA